MESSRNPISDMTWRSPSFPFPRSGTSFVLIISWPAASIQGCRPKTFPEALRAFSGTISLFTGQAEEMMTQAELSLPKVSAWHRKGWTSLPWGLAAQLAGVGTVTCSPWEQGHGVSVPADSHSTARTSASLQSPGMSARNLRGARTTCSSLPVGSWVSEETDVTRHSTGHWAPPLCSWLEEQPNLPAPISREQAPALKLFKTGDVEKKVLH